jgi:hypothetical protein
VILPEQEISASFTGLPSDRYGVGESEATEEVKPIACRFHDLRHTAVSRMLNAGVLLAKIAKIVVWSASTMVLMAKRYGHFSLNELRGAVESIRGAGFEGSPPVSKEKKEEKWSN